MSGSEPQIAGDAPAMQEHMWRQYTASLPDFFGSLLLSFAAHRFLLTTVHSRTHTHTQPHNQTKRERPKSAVTQCAIRSSEGSQIDRSTKQSSNQSSKKQKANSVPSRTVYIALPYHTKLSLPPSLSLPTHTHPNDCTDG